MFHALNRSLLHFHIEIPASDPGASIADIIRTFEGEGASTLVRGTAGNILVAVGDLIPPRAGQAPRRFLEGLVDDFDYSRVLEAAGFFYLVHYTAARRQIRIMSGFCGILPVYYVHGDGVCRVATTSGALHPYGGKVNGVYLAERILFNYPLTTNTLFENIRRLPAHTSLVIDENGVKEHRFFQASALFSPAPRPHRAAMDDLSDLFIDEGRRFIPAEPYLVSFTAGFDGRTLLGMSQYFGEQPRLYSFGTKQAIDIRLPCRQAEELGFNYTPIFLDGEAYQAASLCSGQHMIELSSGEANFARAHYHYAAEKFSAGNRYVLTGNFGSELFRAFHQVGVMCSKWLYLIFLEDEKTIAEQLLQAPEWALLDDSVSKKEVVEAIVEDIRQQEWFTAKALTLNQRFYVFVLEEMFRKYFGPEIVMQFHYLTNRAPYLSYIFVRALFETDLGGGYSDFFEHNKLKRMRGQLFYAHLLRKTSPELYRMPTGKGYRPADLLEWTGWVKLLQGYVAKRMQKGADSGDAFGVESAYRRNKAAWLEYADSATPIRRTVPESGEPVLFDNTNYTALSLAYYLHTLQRT